MDTVKELEEKLVKVTAERDAAIADIKMLISRKPFLGCSICSCYDKDSDRCKTCDEKEIAGNFEWRGLE